MLLAHIAQNIRRQILYYLQSTFSFRDKNADQAFRGELGTNDTNDEPAIELLERSLKEKMNK